MLFSPLVDAWSRLGHVHWVKVKQSDVCSFAVELGGGVKTDSYVTGRQAYKSRMDWFT